MAISKTSVPMKELDPAYRKNVFEEVALGYTEDEALAEAARCLQCKTAPCVKGCPVQIDIPAFIKAITEKKYSEALEIIHKSDILPCVTGRVCPQEVQCQSKCTLGFKGEPVAIGRLERFVADLELQKNEKRNVEVVQKEDAKKIAIVGTGPAGISCAADLAKFGYKVTMFEGFHKPGGVLLYGIPEFRLPKNIVESEVNNLKNLGVEIITDALVGRAVTIDDLKQQGFEAVFVGAGAGLPVFLKIPGENLNGVYSANEFLTRVNLMKAYSDDYKTPIKKGKNVAVVGGGNVAMDAARTALRLGADNVYLIYRRTKLEMPARLEERHHAEEEGIIFKELCNPVAFEGDDEGFLSSVTCLEMKLGEPDDSGRRRPVPIEGSEFKLDIDVAIVSVGTSANPLLKNTTEGLDTNPWGLINVNDDLMTSIPGVFAGGDIVSGAATVITAMGAGRKAAKGIDEYLKNK